MRFLLSSGAAFRICTLKETQALAAELGYDGLELMLPPRNVPAQDSDRDTDYEVLKKVPVVHAPNDLFDEARFVSALREGIDVARLIGAPAVNMHPPSLSFGGRDNVRRGIEIIQQTQRESGLRVLYEVLVDPTGLSAERRASFKETQAYYSVEEWVTDIEEYDLAATLDTCHIGTWGKDPAYYLQRLGSRLQHVHFSDYSRTQTKEHLVPGEGDVDLAGFLRTLAQTHPDITVTVEINPEDSVEGAREAARRSRDYIRGVLAES
jgi:sugar phosphate isomerase/epimerase